jgi:MFS family permease
MPELLRALQSRNFRLFFIGQSVSLVGTWMQQLAAAWLVYRLSGSPLLLGVTGFASQIPILFLAPFGGLLADRLDRRKTLLMSQALAAAQALLLAALTFSGRVEVWHVITAAACLGVINAFDVPLRQAFLLEMVGSRELLGNAIALNSLLMNGSRLIGPPLAGLLLALFGEGWCFLANAASYGAIIVGLAAMHVPPRRRPAVSRWRAELREAVDFAIHYLPCRTLLTLVALLSLLANPYSSLLPVFARDLLGGDARTLGWLNGAASVGAVAGVVFLATRRGIHRLERITALSAATAGAGLIAFALSRTPILSLALLPLVGFGILLTTASANTILQTVVPDRLRGRIVSFHVAAFLGMAPLGHFALGFIAEHFGAPAALIASGVGCLAAALWFASRLCAVRQALATHPVAADGPPA